MTLSFIRSARQFNNLQVVEMDTGVQFLTDSASGFATFGVSSCIVLIGYYKNKLLFMLHASTPGSQEDRQSSNKFVEHIFKNILLDFGTPKKQKKLTIYAFGGQESSLHTVAAIRDYAKRDLNIKLNVNALHLVHHEDSFDLYILRDKRHFYLRHHMECPQSKIEQELLLRPHHPAPLLFAMGFIASHQPEITFNYPRNHQPRLNNPTSWDSDTEQDDANTKTKILVRDKSFA